ncbi:MAG: hypothetical protein IPN17_32790 [Deltaproteobacteria bacterium]|nr:hypothetical protein [Deltaproteobacteria bacterium]
MHPPPSSGGFTAAVTLTVVLTEAISKGAARLVALNSRSSSRPRSSVVLAAAMAST